MSKSTIPATENENYGFWGTTNLEGEGIAQQAWPLAVTSIAEATGEDTDSVRAFLDSSWSRHFADDVHVATCDSVTFFLQGWIWQRPLRICPAR